ncbi:hypothetical protein LguiA_001847 [Lonicera macranthoides]
MYPPFHGGGGRRGTPPLHSPPPINSPTNFPVQNRNFWPNQFPYPLWPNVEVLEMIDRAVVKARLNLLAAGENASAWKVSQAALLILKVDSWELLGVQMQQVPSLHRLIVTEGKINAFIHCFVGVQKITSLYDLEVAICQNEGVGQFEELELGPLVRHPLVVHYFSVSSDVTEVFRITTEEILSSLNTFIYRHQGKNIKPDDFLDFIAKKKAVEGREKLTIRIQSLGMHISHIWKARRSETEERIRLGLTHETDPCPSSASGSLICNEPIQPFKGEMNSENISGNECDPSNVSKRHKVEMNFPIGYEKEGGSSKKNEVDVSLPDEAVRKFLMTWKGACREKSVAEVCGLLYF